MLNRALLPSNPFSAHLFLPPSYSPSAHAQISALIPSFLASFKELNLSLPTTLTKPLRPFWVTQDSALDDTVRRKGEVFEDYRPVICCTASRRVVAGSEADEGGYIQGAADDTENWAHGLTPDVFWKSADTLLQTAEDDLPDLIATLVEHERSSRTGSDDKIRLTPRISICPLPLNPSPNECCIALTPEITPRDTWVKSPAYMEVGLGKSKTASRNLRLALPEICTFASKNLGSSGNSQRQIVIACESGRDLSVGTVLALLCYLFDDEGNFRIPGEDVSFTKSFVKIRLGIIMTAYPGGNPSRNTLQSVNSFLMDWRK